MTELNFLAPGMLWLLLLLPLLCCFAFLAYALTTPASRLWRHTPIALLFMALAVGIVGFARPAMSTLDQPSHVIFAIDVSGGMRAPDLAPSRFVAAQSLAKAIMAELPAATSVGVVAFGEDAELVQE